MNPSTARWARVWVAIALVLTFYKLWLTRGQGLYALGANGQQDWLFVELARHLVGGNWLGPYNELTLAHGPFYPLFIAASFAIGVPLLLAQHIFYALACGLFARALRPVASAGARWAVYALLLWNPMTFDAPQMGRVLSEHLDGPLVLMIFAGFAALYFRRGETTRQQVSWAVATGLAAGALYLNGGKIGWLAPGSILLGLACLYGAAKTSRAALRQTGWLLALACVTAVLPILLVSVQNQRHYDRFCISEARASLPAATPTESQAGGIWASADFVVSFSRFSARPLLSTGTPEQLQLFRDLTGERLSPPAGELDVVGAAEYTTNLARVDRLQAIGKALRPILLILFAIAQLTMAGRAAQLIKQRRWSYALALATAAWVSIATAILVQALTTPAAAPAIAAFAPLYPLVLVFVAAMGLDVATARQRAV